MTDRYRQGLARICQAMAGVCDTVIECSCGIMTLHKGKLPADYEKDFYAGDWSRKMEEKRAKNLQLIIGGSSQGKTEYVRRELGIPAEEIFLCDEDNTVDMNAACLDHFERYLRGCIKRGEKPFSPRILRDGTVIICEDITCGIVPMDALDRKWREETGRYLQEAVKYGALVTRLFCGIPQILENPFQKRRDGKKEVLLLRHGMTCANEEHLYCGRLDPPLSPKGRKALEAGTNNCASGIWEAFYTSGMKRAQETLRILFGEKAAREARVCTGLREMDFGIFEGKSYEELKDTPSYQAWISGSNEKNTCPGGGSGIQMREAAVASFEKILMEESAQRIVIVTHGGPMAAIMQALFPQEDKNRYEWQSDFGKGYLLQINTDSLTGERGLQRKEVSAAYRPFPAEEKRKE
jgi:alpha-ribazole phosphatase